MELVKILLILVFIMALLIWRKPLGPVMIGASVLLAVLFWLPPLDFFRAVGLSLINRTTIELILTLVFIMMMENIMSKKGYMERMLTGMSGLFGSRRVILASIPAIIGLLPSAGGALFSAPLVEKASHGAGLSAEDKAIINNYYRHVVEIFFPTYPTVLLSIQISGIPISTFVLFMLPFSLIATGLGLVFLRKVNKKPDKEQKVKTSGRRKAMLVMLLASLWPFLAMLLLILGFKMPVHIAAGGVMLAVFLAARLRKEEIIPTLKKAFDWKIVLMVFSVMIFKDVLNASGAIESLPQVLAALPIPTYLIFVFLCFLIGILTGMMMPAVAIGLPLAMAAIPGWGLPLVMLIFMSAYFGSMVTPMHLCITITANYYKANIATVLLRSLPVYTMVFIVSWLAYLILV